MHTVVARLHTPPPPPHPHPHPPRSGLSAVFDFKNNQDGLNDPKVNKYNLQKSRISLSGVQAIPHSRSTAFQIHQKQKRWGSGNIGIKHEFSCINIRRVPWEVLKTEADGRGFQHLPRDLANVNELKNHVRALLLHKN